jgi:hypothetical protein
MRLIRRIVCDAIALFSTPFPPAVYSPSGPQGLDFKLLFLQQLEQAKPLGYPVRGDAVPSPELDAGEVMPEHLCLYFPGED